jgi:hypothetical protein
MVNLFQDKTSINISISMIKLKAISYIFSFLSFLLFKSSTLSSQNDSIHFSNNTHGISFDNETNRYVLKGKPVSGTIMSNDTIFNLSNTGDTVVSLSLKKYVNGRISKWLTFHSNGQLLSEANYDTSTIEIILPFTEYEKDGKIRSKYYYNVDSALVKEVYDYENKDYEKFSREIFDGNSHISPRIELDIKNKMPLTIVSHSEDNDYVQGAWLLFDSENMYRLSMNSIYVKPGALFEQSKIQYYTKGRIKSIVRTYENPKLKEEIKFDENGDLMQFIIRQDDKIIYHMP